MKWAVIAVFMVLLTGCFHMIFIVFDYAYNDPTYGAYSRLPEIMNESMTPYYQNWSWNQSRMLLGFFGIGRFVTLSMIPVCCVLEVLARRRSQFG